MNAHVPEWMRDRAKLTELAEHLESVAWRPDSQGDPQCFDQGAAMAAEIVRQVISGRTFEPAETGLTPRQLAEQRKELMEALEYLVNHPSDREGRNIKAIDRAHAALAHARGETP